MYSTLANDQKYIDWGTADLHVAGHSVLVKGGTGVANDRLPPPLGVATEISEADVAFLERNPLWKIHARNGYVTIGRERADPEKVAADMNRSDPPSPKTPAAYADAGEDTDA